MCSGRQMGDQAYTEKIILLSVVDKLGWASVSLSCCISQGNNGDDPMMPETLRTSRSTVIDLRASLQDAVVKISHQDKSKTRFSKISQQINHKNE